MSRPPRIVSWDPSWMAVGSDADDVEAIAVYLADRVPQLSAVVATCGSLDAPTKAAWYALAKRLQTFLSMSSFTRGVMAAAPGQEFVNDVRDMRDKFNAFAANLKAAGCGDVPNLLAHIPPPTRTPPESDATFTTALFSGQNPKTLLLLAAFAFFALRK